MSGERDYYVYPGSRFTLDGFCTGVGQGLSVRDYFAGQALISMGDRRWDGDHSETGTQKQARAAYRIADAMLAERDK